MKDKNLEPRKGQSYICLTDNFKYYNKGDIYTSEQDKTLTDNEGYIFHEWTKEDNFYKYFKLVK